MAPKYDASDFVDADYQGSKSSPAPGTGQPGSAATFLSQVPTREEIETKVTETHQRLTELKRAQEELERERALLEEARRRRIELHTGREEMLQNLTRGIGLLERAELAARTDAEQMAKTLAGLRQGLEQVQTIHEEAWGQDNWSVELTKALTLIENSRMEWNQALLKWPLLHGAASAGETSKKAPEARPDWLVQRGFLDLCKLGLALTWPIALLGLVALALVLALR